MHDNQENIKAPQKGINESMHQEMDIILSDDTDAFENDVLTNCSFNTINRRLIGLTVIHNMFGEGKIIDANRNYITVKFNNKTAKFLYPYAIGAFLTFKNSYFQKEAVTVCSKDRNRL